MQKNPNDVLTIAHERYGKFDAFTSAVITNDLTKPSEAAFTVGDDASYVKLQMMLEFGSKFTVSINGALNMTGRVELSEVPLTAPEGSLVCFTLRTKLADAMYSSADVQTRISEGMSIEKFLLAIYKPLGYTKDDFLFLTDVSRDFMTGRRSNGTYPTDIEAITVDQARVQPPETIFQAAEKHLSRHGLMHWDSPDGRIAVGAPDDSQAPLYTFNAYNDVRSRDNNILACRRTRDASQAPSSITVVGAYSTWAWNESKIRASKVVSELHDSPNGDGLSRLYHPVYIMDSALRSTAHAQRRANQEATQRMMNFDAWEIEVENFSYRGSGKPIIYGIDTVAAINASLIGGPTGSYLVHAVKRTRDPQSGDKTTLALVKKGVWVL